MKKIHIISMGGTFNKVFDPEKDGLVLEKESKALAEISKKGFCSFSITNIENHTNIQLLKDAINTSNNNCILIICDISDIYSKVQNLIDGIEKHIIFMDTDIPYDVDSVAATANLCSVYGQMIMLQEEGVYIVSNGLVVKSQHVTKH